jgi:hypothetical protein
VQANV